MADPTDGFEAAGEEQFASTLERLALRQRELELNAQTFARAMSGAFASSVAGGRQFDDILKSLALRLSDLSLRLAFAPLTRGIAGGLEKLFSGLFAANGAIKPFAGGGVIGAPTYFPLANGIGLAGESGPEAILPLARGPDGRLGVAASGGAASIVINITTPDADSFRRSEVYLTGQIARAVARGQRGL
ncbi:MAG TPA: phage tail tape measure protein [Xanthobacteraceae bacterium]